MNFRIERPGRLTSLALLAAVCGSVLGCWEEVRYEPNQTSQGVQQADRATDRTEIELESQANQGDQAQGDGQPIETDVPAPEQPKETISVVKKAALGALIDVPNSAHTAQAAWQLGSQWSLGAAIYAKGLPAERYEPALELAASAAQILHLDLKPLPKVMADQDLVTMVVTYLLDDQGPRLAEKLDQQYDTRHVALMELAIRSHMLLLVYSPRNMALGKGALSSAQFQAWVDRLAELASSSRLPESVWNPLLDVLREQAPYTEMKRAVFKLHQQVVAELASAG